MSCFNDCIKSMGLWELDQIGARFTCANKRDNPLMSVLDRVLVSADWEQRFPLATLREMTRVGSNHVPLLLAFSDDVPRPLPRFHFEVF